MYTQIAVKVYYINKKAEVFEKLIALVSAIFQEKSKERMQVYR
jgi:hypothetical protein